MDFAMTFGIGFLLGLLGTVFCIRYFPPWKLLDFPERYGLKRAKLPYPGGLAFLLLSLGLLKIDPSFLVLMGPLFLVGVISFLDDRKRLSVLVRLGFYLFAAALVFMLGVRLKTIGDPFHRTNIDISQWEGLSFILTIFWIFALQQALNWFDGLKGLCTGVGGVGFAILAILGLVKPELFFDPAHQSLTLANLYLAGLCLGSFYFYLRGKIILGDTGSQTIGFLLATMSIFSGAKIMTTLLVLSLPILDALLVVIRRMFLEKKAPWKGDLRHLPHNLARKIGETRASLFLVFVSLGFGLLGVFLSGMVKLGVLIFVAFLVLLGGAVLMRKG